jgi:hypothetical protein
MMFGGLETVVGLMAPALVEGFKSIIVKFTGGVQPKSIDDVAKLADIDVRRLEAIAKLDTPVGTPSQWVIDYRAIFRYFAVTLIWFFTGISIIAQAPMEVTEMLLSLAGMTLSFIIGERMMLNFNRK